MKILFITTAALLSTQISQATVLFNFTKSIGCATIVSVRDTSQAPIYNNDYRNRYNGSLNSMDGFALLTQLNVLGFAKAVAASMATDAVASDMAKGVEVIEPKNGWRDLRAVRLRFDDGRVVNLPMADGVWPGHHYKDEIGKRYAFSYSKELHTLMISPPNMEITSDKSQQWQDGRCGKFTPQEDKDIGNAAIDAAANLVDESKIINK